jgi:FAD/FMN-containing dehydrogenase
MPAAADKPAGGVLSLALLNDRLNTVLAVDPAKHQMRVGAGMDMKALFLAAAANKMSVQVRELREALRGPVWPGQCECAA